jgi:DNA polymerase-4
VGEPSETKSIGAQETFETDTLDGTFLIERLQALCESVWERFVKEKFRPKSVVLTVRFRDFATVSRSRSKKEPINSAREFEQGAIGLLLPFLDKRENPQHKKIRLLGIRGENLIRS